jgi:hypothetical protein
MLPDMAESGRRHLINFWSCTLIAMVWLGTIVLIWTLDFNTTIRLVMVLAASFLCLLPLVFHGRLTIRTRTY